MKHDADLLPCPFCGFDATIASDGKVFCGACSDLTCRAEGPIADTEKKAAKRWNKRKELGQDPS